MTKGPSWVCRSPLKKAFFTFSCLAVFIWIFSGWPQISNFPQRINYVSADTATYTIQWASDIEGFVYVNDGCTGGGTCTEGYTAADGNPAGSLFVKVVGKNKNNTGYFKKTLTWEDMGVPNGAIITSVDGSFDYKHVTDTHVVSGLPVIGLKLYDVGDSVAILSTGVDLETEFDPGATSASWSTRNTDGSKSVGASYQSSGTGITVRVRSDVKSGNNNGAVNEVRIDKVILSITYTPNVAPTISVAQPDGTSDTITVGDAYNITYTLADTDDVVTAAFYYDTDNTGLNGTAISGACATAAEGTGATCSWDTTGVTAGSYYVYGVVDDGVNSPVSAYSSGQIILEEPTNSRPSASGVSIDSGATSITLNEGTTKNVSCLGTVTDADGYADITSVTADIYRTSVGTTSPEDANTYYQLSGDAECIPSGGSGNSETYTCVFAVEYYADATDSGSPNESDTWTCTMTPYDSVGQGSSADDAIEVASLLALSLNSNIDYGELDPETDTGATNQTVVVTNTGNREMDPQLSGTDMSCSGNTIAVGQQKYTGAPFTYSLAGTVLTTTATTLNLALPQRTGSVVTASTYWGLAIPVGTAACTPYIGTNTFSAITGTL